MKKIVLLAASALALGAQAGVITLSNDWSYAAQGTGATMDLSSSSATGFTADITRGGYAYQTSADGHFTAHAFNVGDTAIMTFTTTMDAAAAAYEALDYRIMIWDNDQVNGQGAASARMDWGAPEPTTMNVGVADNGKVTGIGTTDDKVQGTDVPSNVFNLLGDSATVSMSVTKQAAKLFDVSLTWDDVTISTNGISNGTGDAMDFISGVGIRLAGSAGNDADFTISNVSVSVIPEPSTLGLVAMVGIGLVAFRRSFRS